MARKKRTGRKSRLAGLPRRADVVVEGSIRQLAVVPGDEGKSIRLMAVLWVEGGSDVIRGYLPVTLEEGEVLDVSEAAATIADALAKPMVGATPLLPGSVKVDSEEIAASVRKVLDPVGVPVAVEAKLPAIDQIVDILASGLAELEKPEEPYSWEIGVDLIRPLFTAAMEYIRRAPWDYLSDNPPIAVRLPAGNGRKRAHTLYGSVLGAGGMVDGIAFYLSRAAFERTLDAGDELPLIDLTAEELDQTIASLGKLGLPVEGIPREILREAIEEELIEDSGGPPLENTLVLMTYEADEIGQSYLDWMSEKGIAIPSNEAIPTFTRTFPDRPMRPLTPPEVRDFTLALVAVNAFLDQFHRELATPFVTYDTREARIETRDGVVVDVWWPGD